MKEYIILLRGINVSGKNKIPMANLRELLNDLKFDNIQTYIQSGNIILTSDLTKDKICKKINKGIQNKFGLRIPVLIRTVKEWEKAIDNYPFSIENEKIVAFTFLDQKTELKEIEFINKGEDQYKIAGDVIYIFAPSGFGKTKLTNNLFEKKLNAIATTRNLKTTLKLLKLTA